MGTIPNVLSWVIFLPLIGAWLLLFLPREAKTPIRYWALLVTLATFALSLTLYFNFDASRATFQFQEHRPWVKEYGISYHLGLDGISLWLILLTTFLSVLSVWFSFYVEHRLKEFMIFMLVLETGMIGVFCALDLVLFYVFWELTLIPMYFLIGIWGSERRIYSAIKFFLYTFLGSVLMLVAILVLYFLHLEATGVPSFDLLDIQRLSALKGIPLQTQFWLFAAFALAFAIKVPMFPFHTWLPDAHTDAPTAGSVILAGVLLKMGTYGFLRFCLPLFPEATQAFVPYGMGLAVVGIVYGAIVAAMQTDMKRLIAYSSVSHMGFIMLGLLALNPIGLMGSVLQQINHGISTGALFLLFGMLYERRHTRQIADFGGLKGVMPLYATFFLIILLSSIGLPSLNGFVGEFLCLLGAFQTNYAARFGTHYWYTVIGAMGVIFAAVYLLWMFQRVFYGPVDKEENRQLKDLKPFEVAILVPLVGLVFWIGLKPAFFFEKVNLSIEITVKQATLPAGERPVWSEKTSFKAPPRTSLSFPSLLGNEANNRPKTRKFNLLKGMNSYEKREST